jgi:hypothetical protein
MAKTLKTPETFTAEVNGITFSFEFELLGESNDQS